MESDKFFRSLMRHDNFHVLDWAVDRGYLECADEEPMSHPYRSPPRHLGGWRLTRKGIDYALAL